MIIPHTFRVFLRRVAVLLTALMVTAAIVIWWAVGTTLPHVSELPIEQAGTHLKMAPVSSLRVATYNIAHGQGIKEQPSDWRDKSTTQSHLQKIATALREMQADVVLLQEVDIDAGRTHHIDQIAYLAKAASYPAYACATLWDKNYLPFPYMPFEHHIGRVLSGNCILSRYPLVDHERLVFDKPASNPFWYNWGYIDRGAEKIGVQVGTQVITFMNIHLEAWDSPTKNQQIRELVQWARHVQGPLVIGGDFNALPPEALIKTHFPDEPDNDYSLDDVIAYMRANTENAVEAIPDNGFTFPTDAPTRRMDYLYGLGGIRWTQGRVVQEAGTASDHFPVLATAQW